MIILITGTPGSSKTLNAIEMIDTDPAFQGRPVYAFNLSELKMPWQTIDRDQALLWYELPKGSVILLDECQDLFPPEKFGNKVPEHVAKLNTHRHLGIDLVLITQHPKLIDTKVRRLVGLHHHFKRQFGLESATRFTFQECADDPNDYFAQKAATKARRRFNKKYYGVYKSSEMHTHKKKFPWQIAALVVLLLIVILLISSVVRNFAQRNSDPSDPVQEQQSFFPPSPGRPSLPDRASAKALTRDEYLEQWVPRIQALPHSAPIYDTVYEVRDFPRPQCMLRATTNSCRCYTQQATPLDIPDNACRSIVANGYWDPTRQPVAKAGNDQQQSPETRITAHERILKALEIRAEIEALKF